VEDVEKLKIQTKRARADERKEADAEVQILSSTQRYGQHI
jgi:hypothetical protein